MTRNAIERPSAPSRSPFLDVLAEALDWLNAIGIANASAAGIEADSRQKHAIAARRGTRRDAASRAGTRPKGGRRAESQ